MSVDMPPQIPPAAIEYLKEHDYLTDEFKKLDNYNAYMYIHPKEYKYRDYTVYYLGYLEPGYYNYKYKNCEILLHNLKETKCANELETYEIERYRNNSNKPKIPTFIVEYVKEHDYLPDLFKEIDSTNAYMYISKFNNKYNNFDIYRLGYSPKDFFVYKNCYLLLHNIKETRCANEEETDTIVHRYTDLSPTGIPPVVIDYVRKYGNVPKNFDNYPVLAEFMRNDGINPDEFKEINIYNAYPYIVPSYIKYKKYDFYYLGFPDVYKYEKNRCQIVLQTKDEIRCATEDEHFEIMVLGADSSKMSGAVFNYLQENNWFENILKDSNNENKDMKIYKTDKSSKKYNGYYYYYVCYGNSTKRNIKEDKCIIILDNSEETRQATDKETTEIKQIK